MEAQNRVELKGGLIIIVQCGDQTYDSVMDITEEVRRLAVGMKKVMILVDHREIGRSDAGARLAAIKTARTLHFDKMAIVGAPTHVQSVITFLMRVSGVALPPQRFFANEVDARTWLTQAKT